jgi:radical SAM superfamily enzyme
MLEDPADRYSSVLFVLTKPDYMLDEYFQYLAQLRKLNFVELDCGLMSTASSLNQYVS